MIDKHTLWHSKDELARVVGQLNDLFDSGCVHSRPEILEEIEFSIRETIIGMIEVMEEALTKYPSISDNNNCIAACHFGFEFWKLYHMEDMWVEKYKTQIKNGFDGFLSDYIEGVDEYFPKLLKIIDEIPDDLLMVSLMRNIFDETVRRIIENNDQLDLSDLANRYLAFSWVIGDYPGKFLLAANTIESQLLLVDFSNNVLNKYSVKPIGINELSKPLDQPSHEITVNSDSAAPGMSI